MQLPRAGPGKRRRSRPDPATCPGRKPSRTGSGGAVSARLRSGGQRFESPQLHQAVRTSRHDFLRRRIARHSRGLRRYQSGKATSISLLVGLGVRADGQKVLLAIKSIGGESEAAWRAPLDDLIRRGLRTPELVVVDGAPGLEKALAALWPDMAVQRCTVHKHRNLAHAPERLHEEISDDYRDMIYAATRGEVETRRKAFIRKWRLKCRAVADSLEEVGDKLFTFTQFPPSQWKSIRTSNAIERLHEEFIRPPTSTRVYSSVQLPARFDANKALLDRPARKDGWFPRARLYVARRRRSALSPAGCRRECSRTSSTCGMAWRMRRRRCGDSSEVATRASSSFVSRSKSYPNGSGVDDALDRARRAVTRVWRSPTSDDGRERGGRGDYETLGCR